VTTTHIARSDRRQVSPSLGFPPDTILTRDQLAVALSVSVDTIERAGIPASYALGSRCPRYIWKDVVAWFQQGGNVT
jgi:hypothetical protein